MTEAVPTPAGATLLVVDDNEMNRDMLSRRLEKRGYRVLTADDGQPALDTLQREQVDLILLDIMMPGLDGIEVLKTVRRKFSPEELPVIMTTAKGDSRDVVEALDLGANDYVTKPIDFAVVMARVQKELRSRRPRAAAPPPVHRPTAEFGPGALIEGKYRLEVKLGAGNFGAVYRASHVDLGRAVAVKILQTRVEENEAALERFRAEGRAACLVRHPNAVAVHDFGVTVHGSAYLVMELLEGRSLAEELKTRGRLSPRRVAEVLRAICAVLEMAHRTGIVHRDIKPENVYIHFENGLEVVKVLDFGIAKLVGDHVSNQNLTAEGFILGTPAYMAPERLKNLPYDGRADVYSLGCMLFQLLTGRLPFPGKSGEPMAMLLMHLNDPAPSPKTLDPELPGSVDRLVVRCMAKDPSQRPRIGELAALFAAAAADAAPPAQRAFIDGDAPTRDLGGPRLPIDVHATTTKTEYPPGPWAAGAAAFGAAAGAPARPATPPPPMAPTSRPAIPPPDLAAPAPPAARPAPTARPDAAKPDAAKPDAAKPETPPPARPAAPPFSLLAHQGSAPSPLPTRSEAAALPPAQTSTSWVRSILDRVFRPGGGSPNGPQNGPRNGSKND